MTLMLRPQGDVLRLIGAVVEPQNRQGRAQVVDGLHEHGQCHFDIGHEIGDLAGVR